MSPTFKHGDLVTRWVNNHVFVRILAANYGDTYIEPPLSMYAFPFEDVSHLFQP